MRTRESAHVFGPRSSATKVQSNLYLFHKTRSRILRKVSRGVSNKASIHKANCLTSCRAGAWHYRIFPDFLNSGLKMASKIDGKEKVIACR